MKRYIGNLNDIKLLVDSFYAQVRKDHLLKDIFYYKRNLAPPIQ